MSERKPNDIDLGLNDRGWSNDTCHSDIDLCLSDRGWMKEDLMI
jgi:hypothetical protein